MPVWRGGPQVLAFTGVTAGDSVVWRLACDRIYGYDAPVTVTLSFDGPKTGFGHDGRLRRGLRALAKAVRNTAAAAVRPHKASLRRLTEMPLTVAAVPLADFAAFHVGHGWGFLATAVSLVITEHLIADE